VLTDANGQFTYPLGSSVSGVVLKDASGSTLLTINEQTGKMKLKDSAQRIQVIPASAEQRTQVKVTDANGEVLFTQELSFPKNLSVRSVADLQDLNSPGIYVKTEAEGIKVARNNSQVPGLPNGAYVTTADNKPIAGISRDGNVYVMISGYALRYRETGDRISYLLVNSQNQIIAEILLNIDAEYVIK